MVDPRRTRLESLTLHDDTWEEDPLQPPYAPAAQRAYRQMIEKGASPLEAHGVAMRIHRYYDNDRLPH